MKTLKQFNTLSPDKQCEFVIDLIDNESDHDLLINLIQDGISQGESKDDLVKIISLFKSINKGQRDLSEELKPLWLEMVREKKLNQIL